MSDDAADSFQASPQQERVWAAQHGSSTQRIQAVLELDGEVGGDALVDAVRCVVRRHEILRTTFRRQSGLTYPLQVVHPALEPHIETVDLSHDDAGTRSSRLPQARATELSAPIDMEQGPLLRVLVATAGPGATHLIITASAMCLDEPSMAMLLAEVRDHLTGGPVAEDPLQYADFAAWQLELGDSDEDEARAARAFWDELGELASPVLPFTRSGEGGTSPQQVAIQLDDAVLGALQQQAERYGAGAAAIAHAAWHVVLAAFSGAESATVAYLAGERRHQDLQGALGSFTRPVPVTAQTAGTRTFAEVVAEVGRARADALVRQDYAPATAQGLDIGFIEYPGLGAGDGPRARIDGMRRSGTELSLACVCATGDGGIELSLVFDPQRHRPETVEMLAGALAQALAAAAGDPGLALADIEVVDEAVRGRLLGEFSGPVAPAPGARAHELIAGWAGSAPDRAAVVDDAGSVTYAELDARANQLAHRLIAAGVAPGAAVGLCTDRSIDMVVGLLGILKAGGAYVPLHYEHPPARLKHQLDTAGAVALVTQEPLLGRLPEFAGALLCLDRDRADLQQQPASAPDVAASSQDLAYVIYTSGSTGAPKGVCVTHANLANYVGYIMDLLGAGEEPLSFGLVTSISTDLGNTSLFGSLCSGGTLVLVSPAAAADPGALASFLEASPVDVLKITPSHVGSLLAGGDGRVLPRRWLVLGGERASWELVGRVRDLSSCQIVNHYGPTETTVGSCTLLVGAGRSEYEPASVPIGRPIANTACRVLDEAGRLVPPGVTGRLFISGAGVATGYAGEPELTASRFTADPFAGGEARMYDTGDLARWLPDGTLEFLGRVDEQVKIRGYRVEPAEIEAALLAHPEVREAVVVARESAAGDARIVAYCTVDGALDEGRLRVHLADWLPEFMLPAAIVVIAEMPRTPSGKIDRLSLPDPDIASPHGAEYVAPATPMEEAVAAMWADVLGVDRVGAQDDFFALGGHSLLATQVVARVRSEFAVDLPLHSLFTYPTVASLASEIVGLIGGADADETARLMAELEGMSDEEAQRLLDEDVSPEVGRA